MGADMDEGTLIRWLKQPGDQVERGEAIAEIETDKATIELESFAEGIFQRAVVEEGAKVPVGEVIAYIAATGEQVEAAPKENAATSRPQATTPPTDSATEPAPAADGSSQAPQAPTAPYAS